MWYDRLLSSYICQYTITTYYGVLCYAREKGDGCVVLSLRAILVCSWVVMHERCQLMDHKLTIKVKLCRNWLVDTKQRENKMRKQKEGEEAWE